MENRYGVRLDHPFTFFGTSPPVSHLKRAREVTKMYSRIDWYQKKEEVVQTHPIPTMEKSLKLLEIRSQLRETEAAKLAFF